MEAQDGKIDVWEVIDGKPSPIKVPIQKILKMIGKPSLDSDSFSGDEKLFPDELYRDIWIRLEDWNKIIGESN